MNGTTQGFAMNPANPNAGTALATLRAINFGANPVSFHVDKPWTIPDPGAMPSSALKGAVGDVINKALTGYQKRQAEKKKEDSDSTKDWMEWQKFKETKRHNEEIEKAAMGRIKSTTPENTSDSDEFWRSIGFAGAPGRNSESTIQEGDSDPEDSKPSLYDAIPQASDPSLNEEYSLKLNVAPTTDPRMQRNARPNPDLNLTGSKEPVLTVNGGSEETQKQLSELSKSDLPSGPGGASFDLVKPTQQGLQSVGALGGLPPIEISEAQRNELLNGPAIKPQYAPRPAPISQAIQQAAQEPALKGMQAPSPGQQLPFANMSPGKVPAFIPQKDAAKALWLINNWEKLGGNPDVIPKKLLPVNKQGMVQIDWENVGTHNREQRVREDEHRLKQEEMKQKFETASAAKTASIAMREGNAVNTHDSMKNYTRASGLRAGLEAFIPAYLAQQQHPETSGAADVDLIDNYARAMSGGKVTEGQVHLIEKATSLKDKLKVLFMKPEGGDILSQGQRDQMLRAMVEAHNIKANAANSVMDTARRRMIKEGVKDEDYLPQSFVADMILKTDAEVEKIHLKESADKLILERRNALASKNFEDAKMMEPEIEKLLSESVHLQQRLIQEKYSGKPILGYKNFKEKTQGFVAGTGGYNMGYKDPNAQ